MRIPNGPQGVICCDPGCTGETAEADEEVPAAPRVHVSQDIEEGGEMILSMGPQHPSTHGVLRLALVTDGEIVKKVTPHLG
jgi:hypothetical protein